MYVRIYTTINKGPSSFGCGRVGAPTQCYANNLRLPYVRT